MTHADRTNPYISTLSQMVLRISSGRPRLPRKYWGKKIYASPGSGKTYVANKYSDVVDGDELLVKAIKEWQSRTSDTWSMNYDDPREYICQYFLRIKFNRDYMKNIYKLCRRYMRKAANIDDVVLFGTKDMIWFADLIFVENNTDIVRPKFNRYREEQAVDEAEGCGRDVVYIHEYLEPALQRYAKGSSNYCIA